MVILYPLATEKSIRLMESENKLIFVVESSAKKADIRKAIEKTFNTKVVSVKTLVGPDSKKRAYVKFTDDKPAIDIATELGMI